jgi:hypothetical protein
MNNGFEIALASMSGTNMSRQHQRRWYEELNGMRLAVERFSYANRSAIIGVRAPMFTVAGDEQVRKNSFRIKRNFGLKEFFEIMTFHEA